MRSSNRWRQMRFHHLRRREFINLLGGAAASWPLVARAQQGEWMPRVGVLMNLAESDQLAPPRVSAFQEGLEKLGWTIGRNVLVDYRFAAGGVERMRALAADLMALSPDVLFASNTPTLAALQQVTRTIPIVFVTVADPIGGGFVQSFARPGGNITGFVPVEPPLGGKWLALLKEIAPSVTRAAVLFNPETAPYAGEFFRHAKTAAASFAVELVTTPIHDAAGIEAALATFGPGGGLIGMADLTVTVHRQLIIALAAKHRLPAVYPYRFFVTDGGLMSYGTDPVDVYRQAAGYVNAILRGAKPADLPVQAATKVELVINLKTAK